jgi:hypothetical protein
MYPPEDLRSLLSKVNTPFHLPDLIREVCNVLAKSSDPEMLQPSLFSLLGDANIETIFTIFEVAEQVRVSIAELGLPTYTELASGTSSSHSPPPSGMTEVRWSDERRRNPNRWRAAPTALNTRTTHIILLLASLHSSPPPLHPTHRRTLLPSWP